MECACSPTLGAVRRQRCPHACRLGLGCCLPRRRTNGSSPSAAATPTAAAAEASRGPIAAPPAPANTLRTYVGAARAVWHPAAAASVVLPADNGDTEPAALSTCERIGAVDGVDRLACASRLDSSTWWLSSPAAGCTACPTTGRHAHLPPPCGLTSATSTEYRAAAEQRGPMGKGERFALGAGSSRSCCQPTAPTGSGGSQAAAASSRRLLSAARPRATLDASIGALRTC